MKTTKLAWLALLFGVVVGIWVIPDRPRAKPARGPVGYRIEPGLDPDSWLLSAQVQVAPKETP